MPDLDLSAWQWRTVLALLSADRRLDAGLIAAMGTSNTIRVDAREALVIAEVATAQRNRLLEADAVRVMQDGAPNASPDDGTFHRADLGANYSIGAAELGDLAEFCRNSGGFDCG